MLRPTTMRPLLKSLSKVSLTRSSYSIATSSSKPDILCRSLSSKRPQATVSMSFRQGKISLLRYATESKALFDKNNSEAERKVHNRVVEASPGTVSASSSVRQVFESKPLKEDPDGDMGAGIKADIEIIKDTFALTDVPRESYYIGAAGVFPYLATSLSTVYLAWNINHAQSAVSGVLFSPETAHQLLSIIEPIQIGYGAVIISFLGAIHWGLEYAGYGGYHGYRRYAFGVIAPAVAWPTMLMPVEYALISQFLAFNFLYFADARATVRGWAPPWYATYRFVLTFVVGASIVVSLIGRGQIVAKDRSLPGPANRMKTLHDSQWENLEREDRERRRQIVEADESDEDGEGEEEDKKDE